MLREHLDEISFVLGPALLGLAAVTAHPAYALGGAAGLFHLRHRLRTAPDRGGDTARTGRTRTGETTLRVRVDSPRPDPSRIPRAVHSPRAALALQCAMFGACQACITAFTERLGQPDQAGFVYAAMGVMSAAAGLSMAAVPARVGLTPAGERPPRRPARCPCRGPTPCPPATPPSPSSASPAPRTSR